jgi:hypothetical protein
MFESDLENIMNKMITVPVNEEGEKTPPKEKTFIESDFDLVMRNSLGGPLTEETSTPPVVETLEENTFDEASKNATFTGEIWSDDPSVLIKGKMPMKFAKDFEKKYGKYLIRNTLRAPRWLEGGKALEFNFQTSVEDGAELAELILRGEWGAQLPITDDVFATRWDISFFGNPYDPPSFINFAKSFSRESETKDDGQPLQEQGVDDVRTVLAQLEGKDLELDDINEEAQGYRTANDLVEDNILFLLHRELKKNGIDDKRKKLSVETPRMGWETSEPIAGTTGFNLSGNSRFMIMWGNDDVAEGSVQAWGSYDSADDTVVLNTVVVFIEEVLYECKKRLVIEPDPADAPVQEYGELGAAARMTRNLPTNILIKAPSGRWVFRGSVDRQLANESFPSREAAIDAAERLGLPWDEPRRRSESVDDSAPLPYEPVNEKFRPGTASHFNSLVQKWAKKVNAKVEWDTSRSRGSNIVSRFIIEFPYNPEQIDPDALLEFNKLVKQFGVNYRYTSPTSNSWVVENETINEEVDEIAATELRLYIDNDGDLYRQQLTPIIKNLMRKINSGKYDHKKAPKLWMYLVDNGARKYVKEFGGNVRDMFPKKTREAVAQSMADDYKEQIDNGEWSHLESVENTELEQLAEQIEEKVQAREAIMERFTNPYKASTVEKAIRSELPTWAGKVDQISGPGEDPRIIVDTLVNQYSNDMEQAEELFDLLDLEYPDRDDEDYDDWLEWAVEEAESEFNKIASDLNRKIRLPGSIYFGWEDGEYRMGYTWEEQDHPELLEAELVERPRDSYMQIWDRLPPKEKQVAEKLYRKGYRHLIQFVNKETGEDFGAPLAFKNASEVGPFMRSASELKQRWYIALENIFGSDMGEDTQKTLWTPDAMVGVMGGPSKEEAREILRRAGYSAVQIAKMEESVEVEEPLTISEKIKAAIAEGPVTEFRGAIGNPLGNRVWVRLGDSGEYEEHDDPYEAGSRVGEMFPGWTAEELISTQRYDGESRLQMGTMTGRNYISLFWGDDDAQHERGLERDELRIFNQGMKEVLEATVPVNPDGPVQEIDQEELPADEGPRFEVQGDKTLSTLTALLEGPKPSQQPIMEARWDEDSIRKELADEFDIEEEDMEVDIDIEEEKDFGIDYWRVEAEGNEYMVFADTDDAITSLETTYS